MVAMTADNATLIDTHLFCDIFGNSKLIFCSQPGFVKNGIRNMHLSGAFCNGMMKLGRFQLHVQISKV